MPAAVFVRCDLADAAAGDEFCSLHGNLQLFGRHQ